MFADGFDAWWVKNRSLETTQKFVCLFVCLLAKATSCWDLLTDMRKIKAAGLWTKYYQELCFEHVNPEQHFRHLLKVSSQLNK